MKPKPWYSEGVDLEMTSIGPAAPCRGAFRFLGSELSSGLPGQTPLQPSVQNALKTAINGQAGPQNPATPAYRDNPEHDWYLALQRVRISAKEAMEHAGEEKGPIVKGVISAIRTAAEQLMAGIDPATVAAATAATMVRESRPEIAAQLEQPKAPVAPTGPPAAGVPGTLPDGGFGPGGPLAQGAPPGAPPPEAIAPPVPAA